MKRTVVYPDWVEKYRTKGRTIRKTKNGFALYECTSIYVKGLKYPKSVQKYLGRITENEGFIPKQIPMSNSFLEYGLSHFIIVNFKRELLRTPMIIPSTMLSLVLFILSLEISMKYLFVLLF